MHTLDLVFTHGTDNGFVGSKDLCVSDHKYILFDSGFTLESQSHCCMRRTCFINKSTAVNFSMVSDRNIVLKDGFLKNTSTL